MINELNDKNDYLDERQITIQAINLLGAKIKGHINYDTKQVQCSCFFHQDKNPSLGITLYHDKVNVYHCFSCGRSGTIYSLYKELTGQSLRQALGLSGDKFSVYSQKSYNYQEYDETKAKTVFLNYSKSDLLDPYSNQDCINYFNDRGITSNVVRDMNISYIKDTHINNTHFRDRLCIPVYENGRLISLEGRALHPDDNPPKVLYPKNASTNTLFDIDNLDKNRTLYALEGLMDLAVLRSDEYFKNSTSIFGAAITKRQMYLLKQFNKIVYIPDLDQPGLKVLELLKEAGVKNLWCLKPPSTINGFSVKDIGDLPKAGVTTKQLREHNWLNYIKQIN